MKLTNVVECYKITACIRSQHTTRTSPFICFGAQHQANSNTQDCNNQKTRTSPFICFGAQQ